MSNIKPNIIFMGTPEFAVPTLELLNKEIGVAAVVTLPDKPKGRGKKMQASEVKLKAQELNLPLIQPESLKTEKFVEELKFYEPDIIIVIAFRILPPSVFNLAKLGAFNIHASLLPKYRGAAPINWAIINGDKSTGLTSFLLQNKVDTGNILLQKEFSIPKGFTAGDLHDLLMPEAACLALDTCKLLLSGDYKPYPQDDSIASQAPKIFPEFCRINWEKNAETLSNFIHGVSPVPGAWTLWNNSRFKIHRVEYTNSGNGEFGSFKILNDKMIVQCGKGSISLIEVQPEAKKLMKISEFLNGYRGESGGNFE